MRVYWGVWEKNGNSIVAHDEVVVVRAANEVQRGSLPKTEGASMIACRWMLSPTSVLLLSSARLTFSTSPQPGNRMG